MECNIKSVLGNINSKESNLPLGIKCELTYRCNFTCRHCYCRLPQKSMLANSELSFKEWDRILGESVDEGALFLTFTGGEPLLRPDFKDIWKMAKRRGLLISLFTNGSFINEKYVEFFQQWSPTNISITLYGATESTYQTVTGIPGMFSKVLANIELLQKANIPVSTRSIITKRNITEFRELEELNNHYVDSFFWDAELFGTSEHGGGFPFQERLSPEELVELEFNHRERREGLEEYFPAYYGTSEVPVNSYRCSLGKRGFGIDPYGKMHACLVLEPIKYDLRKGTIRDGWYNYIPKAIKKLEWGSSPCRKCDLALFCRICPAYSLREGGLQEGPTDYHCAIGKVRFEKFKYSLKNTIPK